MPRLTGTQRMLEVAMILSSALAMFMLLALLSFHQGDASWSQSGAYQEIQNAAGSIGAKCADFLFTWFGYTAYALPFLSAFVGWFLFQKKHHILELDYLNISLRLIGVVLMFIACTSLASLNFNDFYYFSSGGVAGAVMLSMMSSRDWDGSSSSARRMAHMYFRSLALSAMCNICPLVAVTPSALAVAVSCNTRSS